MDLNTLKQIIELYLILEYLGINIEYEKMIPYGRQEDKYGLPGPMKVFITVPEFSIIDVPDNDKEFNDLCKTASGLEKIAKNSFIELLTIQFENELTGNDSSSIDAYYANSIKDIIKDIKDNSSEYVKVFSKVRKNDVWNDEKGKLRIKKVSEMFSSNLGYKEV